MAPEHSSSGIRVQHPWPLRLLRTAQFGLARLIARGGYVQAHAAPFDLTFKGPAADCITRHIYRLGSHEPVITRYLLDHVRLSDGEIALDIGANLGWYSVLLDRLSVPGARIFAFEPDPHSYGLLTANLAANSATAVTPLNIALGDRPGMGELHRYRDTNNGRHTLLAGNTSGGLVSVPVSTLTDFWNSRQLGERRIRFLKIDVEGYEYFVLRGAGDLLRRCDCMLLEYSPEGLQVSGLPSGALVELLAAAGLGIRAFSSGRLVPMTYAALAAVNTQHDLIVEPLGR